MRFSVIIAAYNAEKTIEKCLLSLKKQTYTDFEAIVINDGSTDCTEETVTDLINDDPRFRCLSQQNRGVSAARNRGLDTASGKFIVFLDSDDCYDPQYLQSFNDMIERYPEHDHFWCGYRSVNACSIEQSRCVLTEQADNICAVDRSKIMDLHEKSLDAALWNKAFRRQILEKHHLRMDESLSLGEDLLFNFGYLNAAKPQIIVSSQPLYIYTKAENGTLDSKFRPDLKDNYALINEIMLQYLHGWNVAADQITKYYNSVFYSHERVLWNTYRPECALTAREKRTFNRRVVKSEAFQTALTHSDCKIHPLYRQAYAMKSWDLVILLDGLAKLRRKLTRK